MMETHKFETTVQENGIILDALLHESFVEHGRSGQTYTKADILQTLPQEKPTTTLHSHRFTLAQLSDDIALLTYKSAHADADADGALSHHALRASLWQRTAHGWQMRFHQGTPTAPFPPTDE